MKRALSVSVVAVGLVVMGWAGAEAAEDFMMKAVRDTMEGDVKGYVKHMFPKEDVISVVTAPAEEKLKEIHPRKMAITMSNDVKISLAITGRVNRENTGGLPYTIEVIKVSDLKCLRKDKPALPEGAQKALADVKDLIGAEARKAALESYPGETVESVTVSDLVGDQDRRSGTATVAMSHGIKVGLAVLAGYAFDPKANSLKADFSGFIRADCTKNGQVDTPAKPVATITAEPVGK